MKKTFKTRNAELTGNGRSSFRFETTTWDTIDRMAAKRGIRWQDWARDVLAAQPDAPNKAALLRIALADELMTEQLMPSGDAGPVEANINHEIMGNGYWRLNDEELEGELAGATITTRDNSFVAFTLITGYRSKESGGQPFVIVQNALRDRLHLMIAPTVE
ncbi:ribbon-helix-helix domain-containing protein [Cronobacter turicensis]